MIGKQTTDKNLIASGFLRCGRRSHGPRQRTAAGTGSRLSGQSRARGTGDPCGARDVPDAEQLSLLPFPVGDLAGFHVDDVLPGRALMLVDTPDSCRPNNSSPHFCCRLAGGPAENDDHGQFARMTFGEIVGIKDVQITMSEPLRIGGQQGLQTMAQAKDMGTGTDIMVVQWLRFGSGGFMHMVGIARADVWTPALAASAVRDGIELR